MKEYEEDGHMKLLSSSDKAHAPFRVFLPHHFVLKSIGENINKLLVVFDASAKTSTGFSLNDAQLVGPTIQETLHTILMRFRSNPVAFTADITKMYRQVLVIPSHQNLQCIVWRFSPSEPIQEYKLRTVTYGTAAAPFLATRVLRQMAQDEAFFPLASVIAKRDFYVDDCMSGARNIQLAREVIEQLRKMTHRAGMPLCKFASNEPAALLDVPDSLREKQPSLSMEDGEVVKALGLFWNTKTDEFFFQVRPFDTSVTLTKRVILSEVSRLFDPMGWLAPTVISTKILIQELWKEGTACDELRPEHLTAKWTSFKSLLKTLEFIRIPRFIHPAAIVRLELHGFCDASEKAYAAVLYTRVISRTGLITTSLVAAKTKVAPVKTISLPRLELCGALLLADLLESTQDALQLKFASVHAWTDSTIILNWLSSSPFRWKTFVANKVSKIQGILPRMFWDYVSTLENRADCASRVITPDELVRHPLWWTGPKWLSDHDPVPFQEVLLANISELVEAEEKLTIVAAKVQVSPDIIIKFSTLLRLKRVIAFCLRFISNCKSRKNKSPLLFGPLTTEELQQSLHYCIKIAQEIAFSGEISSLSLWKPLPKSSKLLSLAPFLDSSGLLRVGGRLRHAILPMEKRTPLLLPRHHHLTTLIIRDAHLRTLHGGPQLVQAVLSDNF